MAAPMIETGYKPEFALGALYAGENSAYAEQSQQEDMIKQFLANQRERQMQPLDVQKAQWEAASAQDKLNNPEYRRWALLGQIGQNKTQDAAGNKSQSTWESDANLTNAQNKNKITTEQILDRLNKLKLSGEGGSFSFGNFNGGNGTAVQPTSSEGSPAYLDVMQQLESGGRRFARDGSLLKSKKGALGENQVMPGTIRNPGYDVTPAKDESPDEIARVGRDYMKAMWSMYEDDPEQLAKSFASYNTGPGRVAGLVKQYGRDWFSHLPDETKQYVEDALGKMNGSTDNKTVASTNKNPLLAFSAPQRNAGINPGQSEYEQLMSMLVDTPELRSKLIQGDQKQSGEDYRQLLRLTQATQLAQLKQNLVKDPKTAEEVIARLQQKIANGDELSDTEAHAYTLASSVIAAKVPVAPSGTILNPEVAGKTKDGKPVLQSKPNRPPIQQPTVRLGADGKKITVLD